LEDQPGIGLQAGLQSQTLGDSDPRLTRFEAAILRQG